MAETAAGDAATIDAGRRRIGAPRLHDFPGIVFGAVCIRRRTESSFDADPRLENERGDGARLRRDDSARLERRRGARVVPVARQEAEIYSRWERWRTVTADDSL